MRNKSKDGQPIFIETELGKEKYCSGCEDYFPATNEFFYRNCKTADGQPKLTTLCKACFNERYRPHLKRCYDISHRYAA